MEKINKINELYIKGWITDAEYEALYKKHAPEHKEQSGAASIIEVISKMSIEELLETYKDAERMLGKAGASVIHLLIVAELEKRITG